VIGGYAAGDDELVEGRVQDLIELVTTWATSRDLWHDATFKTWLDHFDSEPRGDVSTLAVLTYEGPLYEILNGYSDGPLFDEFLRLLDGGGYHVEFEDAVTALFFLRDDDDPLQPILRDRERWRWTLRLVKDDVFDLHEEVYEAFASAPGRLADMSWRQFEKFLDGAFRNNGFSTSLGSGSGDGGVDLRLYSHDAIGELTTLVQAKKYRRRAITLDAVQALAAAVDDERANRGLFVTTSRYLPSAKEFAARRRSLITLADSTSVSQWSAEAAAAITNDRLTIALGEARNAVATEGPIWLDGRIYVASVGYNCIRNSFAVLLKSTAAAGLMVTIPSVELLAPPGAPDHLFVRGQRGHEVPKLDLEADDLRERALFRARRSGDRREHFWGRRELYVPWDREPCWFDHMD
jgi:hypothetical protein